MKLNVLYRDDGRIVALSPVAKTDRDERGVPTPRSGVVAGEGQRVAMVELDAHCRDKSPTELIEHFVVVQDGHDVRLRERGTRE